MFFFCVWNGACKFPVEYNSSWERRDLICVTYLELAGSLFPLSWDFSYSWFLPRLFQRKYSISSILQRLPDLALFSLKVKLAYFLLNLKNWCLLTFSSGPHGAVVNWELNFFPHHLLVWVCFIALYLTHFCLYNIFSCCYGLDLVILRSLSHSLFTYQRLPLSLSLSLSLTRFPPSLCNNIYIYICNISCTR